MEFPLKEGEVRINKESFTNRVFRTYIDAEYNVLDYGSSLSLEEREAVTVMDFSDSIKFSGETLDSFEYFPALERLDISSEGEIVLGTMKEDQYWTISADGTKIRYRSEGEWERRKNEKH